MGETLVRIMRIYIRRVVRPIIYQFKLPIILLKSVRILQFNIVLAVCPVGWPDHNLSDCHSRIMLVVRPSMLTSLCSAAVLRTAFTAAERIWTELGLYGAIAAVNTNCQCAFWSGPRSLVTFQSPVHVESGAI